MSKQKAKQGTTPTFSHTFGSGLKQVAPNEHVKAGDVLVSSTGGHAKRVGGSDGTTGSVKKREPEEACCGLDCSGCADCK